MTLPVDMGGPPFNIEETKEKVAIFVSSSQHTFVFIKHCFALNWPVSVSKDSNKPSLVNETSPVVLNTAKPSKVAQYET